MQKIICSKQLRVRNWLLIVLLISFHAAAQTGHEKLEASIKSFHQALVNGNVVSLNQHTDKGLSYGHSNGWVETKNELLKNLETGYIKYHSYKEDSLSIVVNEGIASARFIADIKVTLNNTTAIYHLKVLEIWVKKGKRWLLFARQGLK